MTNKYAHLTVEQLQEAKANAERIVAEHETEIMEIAKDMGKKKNTLADIKSLNHRITWHFETKKEWEAHVAEYEEAIARAEKVEAGNEAIVEFLEYVYEQDVKWLAELKEDYKEKGVKYYTEQVRKGMVTKSALQLIKMPTAEAHKAFKKDLEARYVKLVATVTKKVGDIVSIEVKRNWNDGFDGWVTGTNGTCHLTTILAGGYNIQRLHYRTLCK